MAKVKEAQMARDELLDNIQKFVLCGRAMLDAMEDLTNLYFCTRSDENEAVKDQVIEPVAEAPTEPEVENRASEAAQVPKPGAVKTATLEEVRALLTEKSRKGFRAEVKALLTAHGAAKLTEITDPAVLGQLMEEAERIGVST